MRMLPPTLFVQSGSCRATRHLLIRARGASGKVARGSHVTSSGSQPTVYRPPARTFVLPRPVSKDGLTISPSPIREQPDNEAPTDHIPDDGIVERFHKTVLDEFYRIAFRKKIYGSIAELRSTSIPGSKVTTRKGRTRGVALRQDTVADLP